MPSVMFVSPAAYTLSGLATWLDYLLPGLDGLGWNSSLCLVSGPHHHRPEKYLEVHPGTRVEIAHCRTGTAEGRVQALMSVLRRARPDIVVSVNVPDTYSAVNRLRGNGGASTHLVMSVHGIEAFLYADASKFRSVIDGVICSNKLACELTKSHGGVAADRVLYSAYGVHIPQDAALARDADCLRIVYSGRLETPQKRVGDLVGILQALDVRGVPFQLEIAGDGPDRDALQEALQHEIQAGRVKFHGQVPISRLKGEIYSAAHAMLITSSWETGPIVAWEAMAQGLPVVSARYVGAGLEGALIDGGNALLFDVGDTDGAAAALEALWRDAELRLRLGEAARRLVETRYSIPVSITAWSDSLHQILSGKQLAFAPLPESAPGGRLDRWLGSGMAERLRKLTGKRMSPAVDAGGEWPHSLSKVCSDEAFWQTARHVDQGPARQLSEQERQCD